MSRIRAKLATAGMLTGAAVGATLVAAIPASAATAPCPANNYCFYSEKDYRGWELKYNDTLKGEFNNPPYSTGDRRDELSSIINNGNRTICIYNDDFGEPTRLITVQPYQDVKNLADFNKLDNRADRWKVNC